MSTEKSRTWSWEFDSPPKVVWTALANTQRFNEAIGAPTYKVEELPQSDGSVISIARARKGPFDLEWEEAVVDRVFNRWFHQRRIFLKGPLKTLNSWLKITQTEKGCRAEFTIAATPSGMMGRLILATRFFSGPDRVLNQLAANMKSFADGTVETPYEVPPPTLALGSEARIRDLKEAIDQSPFSHGLTQRLADFAFKRQDADVSQIRPLALARLWNVPARHAVEVCLQAAKQGLLGLRWHLLCPHCQGGKGESASLDQLPVGEHCNSCNIDFDREYSGNVELAFHPAAAIRPVETAAFCTAGPMVTPHVVVQISLKPGETRTVTAELAHGSYRLRTVEPGPSHIIDWHSGGFPEVIANVDSMEAGAPVDSGKITLTNRTGRRLALVIEERGWARDALTADRVTTYQAFRDLFSREMLRPGDTGDIDHVTLMFTDLKGSTALYNRVGDPEAYAQVRDHFSVLGTAVRENNGAVVKTIGDAIMAAFANPLDGLAAAIQIQNDMKAHNSTTEGEPLIIKIGLNTGRCIAVTLNDRLDYYGATANLTARLESQSQGGDIILSESLTHDAAICDRLTKITLEKGMAELKGFADSIPYFRVLADDINKLVDD